MNTGPNMTILCSVIDRSTNEVIYQTWDRSTAELFDINNKGKNTHYSYTSNLPSNSIAFISNEQASRDYHNYLLKNRKRVF